MGWWSSCSYIYMSNIIVGPSLLARAISQRMMVRSIIQHLQMLGLRVSQGDAANMGRARPCRRSSGIPLPRSSSRLSRSHACHLHVS